MPILPSLRDPCEMLNKLARERVRAVRSEHDEDLVDHFLNFCITGWALTEYVRHACGLSGEVQRAAYKSWLAEPRIVACRDIGNRTKHFQLTKNTRTQEVRIARTGVVDIYEDAAGALHQVVRADAPVIEVVLNTGNRYNMWDFLHCVITFWEGDLKSRGIECR